MYFKKLIFQTKKGHAIAEYGLAIGLVSIVSIGALTLLGGQVSALLSSSINTQQGQLISNAFQSTDSASAALYDNFPDITLTNSAGREYQLPNYPATAQQFEEMLETDGSNGTRRLAAFLEALSQIQDPELLSKEDQDVLKFLANSGFSLSNKQNEIQQIIQNNFKRTDPETQTEKEGLNNLDLLKLLNLGSSLKIENAQAAMKADGRPLFQNPTVKALVIDAVTKLQASAKGSTEATSMVMTNYKRAVDMLNAAKSGGLTSSQCDNSGCRQLTPVEILQNAEDRLNSIKQQKQFNFGKEALESIDNASLVCLHSKTGKISPEGTDCQ